MCYVTYPIALHILMIWIKDFYMTSKLHIKPVFNTAFNLLTNIKAISTYSLLTSLLALFALTASITPAQAELVDLSDSESVIQFSTRDASWLRPPRFDRVTNSMHEYLTNCTYYMDGDDLIPCEKTVLKMVFSLHVDKQGSIKYIKVIESSGVEKIDRIFTREIYKARLKPFFIEGQAVEGRVTLPIEFK